MPRKPGQPKQGEIVIAKITDINPNSAVAQLVEYSSEGLIHVSEIARGWVRNIREYLKPGQLVVALVLTTEPLTLSIKRVSQDQEAARIKEFRLEQRAEKILELIGKSLGKSLDEAYREIGFQLIERYGSLQAALKIASTKPALLDLPEEWKNAFVEIAKKSVEKREIEISAQLHLWTTSPQGINIIKDILTTAQASGIEVRYIAAPNYLLKWRTTDPKRGEKMFTEKLKQLVKAATAAGMDASYEIIKRG
jgi:translation initiation factor 2 subunit 1